MLASEDLLKLPLTIIFHISSGSEALPCPLAGCQGSISRQFSS
eukprot:COSAG06_NODE_4754_length_3981_cov_2.955458_9_plen_42_part_01